MTLPVEPEHTLYPLKNDVQLLLDNEFLDDCWQLRRAPELPVKSYRNPVLYDPPPFEPGGPTVVYDRREGLFKCWYGVADTDLYYAGKTGCYKVAYAFSEDGIHWVRPPLGLFEVRGSRRNNAVFMHPGAVYVDEHGTDPSERYKMLYVGDCGGVCSGLCAAFSADGIVWHKHGGCDIPLVTGPNDTNNAAFFDPELGTYVRYGRVNVLAAATREDALGIELKTSHDLICYTDALGLTHSPATDFPNDDDFVEHQEAQDYLHRHLHQVPYHHTRTLRRGGSAGCNRRIVRSTSADFRHWSVPELVLAPDELDPAKFYGITVCRYEGFYLGLLQVYNSYGSLRRMGDPGAADGDTIDLQLAFSRDGRHWERLANRPTFIPRGYVGSCDGGMVFGSNNVLVEHGDHLWFYYIGTVASHTVNLDTTMSLCVARTQRGRLVARCAGDEMGALITRPFVLRHGRITLNADARRGLIRAEVTDLDGAPLPGFAVTASGMLRDNGLECELRWQDNASLVALRGRTVRLRLYLWQARVYSINFRDADDAGAASRP